MIFRITFDFEKAANTGEVVSLPPSIGADGADAADADDLIVVVALLEADDKKSHEQRQKEICEDWVEHGKLQGINPRPGSPKFEEFICNKRGYKIHTNSAKRLKSGMDKLYAWLSANIGQNIPDELWEEVRAKADIVSFSVN